MSSQPPIDLPPGEPWTRSGPGPAAPADPDTRPPTAPGPYAPPPAASPPGTAVTTSTPERPKRRWLPIIGGAVGAIVAAVLFALLRSGSSDAMPSVDKWTTFTDPGGRFSVSMPKEPERTTQQVTEGDLTLDVIGFTAGYGDSAVVVGYTDYPEDLQLGAPEDVLEGAVQGSAQATNGTVVSSAPATVAGRPAMDAEIQAEEGRALSRFVLDGRRLYILTTASRQSRSDIQRHLTDSFTLTGG